MSGCLGSVTLASSDGPRQDGLPEGGVCAVSSAPTWHFPDGKHHLVCHYPNYYANVVAAAGGYDSPEEGIVGLSNP